MGVFVHCIGLASARGGVSIDDDDSPIIISGSRGKVLDDLGDSIVELVFVREPVVDVLGRLVLFGACSGLGADVVESVSDVLVPCAADPVVVSLHHN
ncbi:hypothetical protein ACFPYI_14745 [Halomarina salina]|uniref:Uncharacterized protein n=1 Tax=Halomarina salina TaxID=1872699 RepID=A0ABD5RQM9_9EURY|nr:hypothetical protein [Halomarina salina]